MDIEFTACYCKILMLICEGRVCIWFKYWYLFYRTSQSIVHYCTNNSFTYLSQASTSEDLLQTQQGVSSRHSLAQWP